MIEVSGTSYDLHYTNEPVPRLLLLRQGGIDVYNSSTQGFEAVQLNSGTIALSSTRVSSVTRIGEYWPTTTRGIQVLDNDLSAFCDLPKTSSGPVLLAMAGDQVFVVTNEALLSRPATCLMSQMWGMIAPVVNSASFVAIERSFDESWVGTVGRHGFATIAAPASYTEHNTGIHDGTVVAMLSGNTGGQLFAGTDAGLFVSADRGNNWAPVTSLLLDRADPVAALARRGAVLYAGIAGKPFRSDNDGQDWTDLSTGGPTSVTAIAVDPIDSTKVFACDGSLLWSSTSSGASWAQSSMFGACLKLAIVTGGLYVSTGSQVTLRTSGGAAMPVTNLPATGIYDVAASADGAVYAAAGANGLYRIEGTVATPIPLPISTTTVGVAVAADDPNLITLATVNGAFASFDRGVNFTRLGDRTTPATFVYASDAPHAFFSNRPAADFVRLE